MTACATHKLTSSASVTSRRAFAAGARQEIVGCAINDRAESVEVGVHRGLLVDGVVSTADFGLSVENPFATAIAVESII